MANTVQITFEIDRDSSGRTRLRQIDDDLNRIGATSRNTGRSLDGAFAVFKGTLIADFFKRAVSEAVNFGKTAVQKINEVRNATLGLQAIAAFRGISPDAATDAVKNLNIVKLGILSTGDAARALKDLLTRFDLDQSVVALERFADIASVNRQNNLSLGEAIVTGAQAVKNLNSILLDNLGISKNISLITKEYGFSMEELDDPTKKVAASTAFFNGLMKETAPFIGKVQEIAGTFQGRLISLDAAWSQLLQTVGDVITQNPDTQKGLNDLGKSIGELIKELANADSPARKTLDTITSGFGDAVQIIARLIELVRGNSGLASTGLFAVLGVGAAGFTGSKVLGLVSGVVNGYGAIKAAQIATAEAGAKGFSKMDLAAKAFQKSLDLIAAHPAIAALAVIGSVIAVGSVIDRQNQEERRDQIGRLSSLPLINSEIGITDDQVKKLDEKLAQLKKIRDEFEKFSNTVVESAGSEAGQIIKPSDEAKKAFLKERGFESLEAIESFEKQIQSIKALSLEQRKAVQEARRLQESAQPLNKEEQQKVNKFLVDIRNNVRETFTGLRSQLNQDNPFVAAFERADKASDTFSSKVEILGDKFGNLGQRFIKTFEEMNARVLALDIFKAELASTERIQGLLAEADALRNNPQIARAFEVSETNKRLERIRKETEIDDELLRLKRIEVARQAARGGNPQALRDFDNQLNPISQAARGVRSILAAGDLRDTFQTVLDATKDIDFSQIESLRQGDALSRSRAGDLEQLLSVRRRALEASRQRAIDDATAVDPAAESAQRILKALSEFDPTRFENERDARAAQAALLDKVIAVGGQIDPAKLTNELREGRVKALETRADLENRLKQDAEEERQKALQQNEQINKVLGLLLRRLGDRAIFEIVDKTAPGTVEIEEILGAADRALGG